ncbi:DUF6166 domain-containing protein [Streptomyces lavendulae]|uniref:DUF6166 domain-containing protein n=1 Tax=Streptomyces lavendulae TaxID=1914 RepID=UPI0033C6449D
MAYEDRTYHGIPRTKGQTARLLVESPEDGPTQRLKLTVLRELRAKDEEQLGGFGWGYNGSGTSRAAAAILADALDLGDPIKAGISFCEWPQDDILIRLREDFCIEVLSQFCDEWRLRRGVIVRWAHSWFIQRGITELPGAVRDLPPLENIDA